MDDTSYQVIRGGLLLDSEARAAEPADILIAGDHHGSTYFQHERFRDLVRTGKGAPEVSLADGAWAVLIGEAAEQSARTGKPVDLTGGLDG